MSSSTSNPRNRLFIYRFKTIIDTSKQVETSNSQIYVGSYKVCAAGVISICCWQTNLSLPVGKQLSVHLCTVLQHSEIMMSHILRVTPLSILYLRQQNQSHSKQTADTDRLAAVHHEWEPWLSGSRWKVRTLAWIAICHVLQIGQE